MVNAKNEIMLNETNHCLHVLFEKQVKRTPESIAVVDGDRQLTYSEVNNQADLLASYLRSVGTTIDSAVGIYMPRSVEYVIAVLGILKAGGAYCPFEVAYPREQLLTVIEDVTPTMVLTVKDIEHFLPTDSERLCMDKGWQENLHQNNIKGCWPIRNSVEPDINSLCYIVYSSGTTGKPKGMRCSHEGPVCSYIWRFSIFDYEPNDRVACNVYFVWEAMRPLLRGASTYIIPDDVIFDPLKLAQYFEHNSITQSLFTPSLCETVINTLEVPELIRSFRSLKCLFLNGEVVTISLRNRFNTIFEHTKLINLYSISECADVAALDLSRPSDPSHSPTFCPVGKPMRYCTVQFLDAEMRELPQGETGELYIGGRCLARDYLGQKEKTAARFPTNPFTNKRLYRTGDKGRYLPDGNFEIIGRCDLMVRIRGYAVDMGFVEACIRKNIAVRSCALYAEGEEGQDKRLVAYLLLETNKPTTFNNNNSNSNSNNINIDNNNDTNSNNNNSNNNNNNNFNNNNNNDNDNNYETNEHYRLYEFYIDPITGSSSNIRDHLSQFLAHYMIPSCYVIVDHMPSHPITGKCDIRALPPPPKRAGGANYKSPEELIDFMVKNNTKSSAKELKLKALVSLFCFVLQVEEGLLTSSSDFFSNGGHSLSAARLLGAIRKVFGNDALVMKDIFSFPTPEKLLTQIESNLTIAVTKNEFDYKETEALFAKIKKDSLLPPEITSSAKLNLKDVVPLESARKIFLTGATGFVGAFVLQELLKKTTAIIYCLVRTPKTQNDACFTALDGLRRNLQRKKIWKEGMEKRVHIIEGDLGEESFGLDKDVWKKLSHEVDAVFHVGAHVNLVLPYDVLRNTNVLATKEIIKLSTDGNKLKPVHYVSSNAVFPLDRQKNNPCLENENMQEVLKTLDNGYGQTKWASEQLLMEAGKKISLPYSIFRLGNVGGHSETGVCNENDFQFLLCAGSISVGAFPIIDGWEFEWTPVDFVAQSIVHNAGQITLSSLSNNMCNRDNVGKLERVFHIVNPITMDSSLIHCWLEAKGYKLALSSFKNWANKLQKALKVATEKKSEKSSCSSLNTDYTMLRIGGLVYELEAEGSRYLTKNTSFFDHRNFDLAVRCYQAPSRPIINVRHLNLCLTHLIQQAVFPRLKRGLLEGKVAVVTGASSGIGAAVCRALANEGAYVTLAARRENNLKEVQDSLPALSKNYPHNPSRQNKESETPSSLRVVTDVTDRKQVKEMVAKTTKVFGRHPDILINVAGVMYFTLMKNLHEEEWERTIDVCVKGTLNGIGAVLNGMLERGSGHIVNVTSDAGRKVFPGLSVYSGAKFAIEAISQGLRLETADQGLKVTCIQPGNVNTDLLRISTDKEGLMEYGTPTGAKVLDPEDIAEAVLYAVAQPSHSAVNEIMIEPRQEPC